MDGTTAKKFDHKNCQRMPKEIYQTRLEEKEKNCSNDNEKNQPHKSVQICLLANNANYC